MKRRRFNWLVINVHGYPVMRAHSLAEARMVAENICGTVYRVKAKRV